MPIRRCRWRRRVQYRGRGTAAPWLLRRGSGVRRCAGSSDLSVGGWSPVGPSAGGGEQDSEPVVLEGAQAVGEASGLLDEQVDGLGAAVGDAVGLEPG